VFVRDRFPVLISQGGPEGTWCGSGRSRRAMAWHPPVAPHWDPGLPACIGGGSAATMWEDVTTMVMATPMAQDGGGKGDRCSMGGVGNRVFLSQFQSRR
jgi:hypothetical protein